MTANSESRITAPIALFVYNRPWHTRQTVESLLRNDLAGQSELFIFSDAPRKVEAADAVRDVREYIRTIAGFKSIHIVEQDKNQGLANSIISGASELCDKYGKVIVLEDDLVVSPFFLEYLNSALDRYADEEKVMQISANMFPVLSEHALPETFFCRMTTSWGWATWKRAWRHFEPDAGKLAKAIEERKLKREFDMENDFFRMLKMQAVGRVDSWAVRWYASVFLRGGFCLHPSVSHVVNIGHDGSGIHSGKSKSFDVRLATKLPSIFPDVMEESSVGRMALEAFFRAMHGNALERSFSRVKSALRDTVKQR